LELPKNLGKLLKCHNEFLWERGFIPQELSKLWGIKGIGMDAELEWRVFIPYVLDGETVSWSTRTVGNEVPKYKAAREDQEVCSSKDLLYGEDFCKHRVMVVEGPTDVWAIGPGAVAVSGVAYSIAQVLRISQFPVRYICFDNEPSAQRKAKQLCQELSVFEGVTQNVEINAKDPGSAKKSELKQLRKLLHQ
jgi:DNA primase